MAAAGLTGIWGFEQLDKTGIATWNLGACLDSHTQSSNNQPTKQSQNENVAV
jgi:hypothetical protein